VHALEQELDRITGDPPLHFQLCRAVKEAHDERCVQSPNSGGDEGQMDNVQGTEAWKYG
jgi:hypothetical protein